MDNIDKLVANLLEGLPPVGSKVKLLKELGKLRAGLTGTVVASHTKPLELKVAFPNALAWLPLSVLQREPVDTRVELEKFATLPGFKPERVDRRNISQMRRLAKPLTGKGYFKRRRPFHTQGDCLKFCSQCQANTNHFNTGQITAASGTRALWTCTECGSGS